jgi:hypothetical protein
MFDLMGDIQKSIDGVKASIKSFMNKHGKVVAITVGILALLLFFALI